VVEPSDLAWPGFLVAEIWWFLVAKIWWFWLLRFPVVVVVAGGKELFVS
jgi:hypothetical protein